MNRLILACLMLVAVACSKEKRSSEAGLKMQNFVINISDYARTMDPNFIIIPQNGMELAYTNLSIDEGLNQHYLNAIDGIGIEALYYNGESDAAEDRVQLAQGIQPYKKVLVSEVVNSSATIQAASDINTQQGFICFVRTEENYHYTQIPPIIANENSQNILNLQDAQNFLYLINSENYTTKEAFLSALQATNYDVLLIDAFFEETPFSAAEIASLKTKANGGQRLVIAYMNIGSAEKYRYYWKKGWGLHHPLWLKKKYDGYPDEFWVKYWKKDWQDIIYGNNDSYTKKLIDAGFDGAYLDNVEGYYFLYYKD